MPENDIDQFLHVFLQESNDRFEVLNQELVTLEEDPRDEEKLYSILRHVHSLKGSAGMFGFDNLKQVAHRLEDLMAVVHKSPDLVDRDVMDALFEGCDLLQASFKRILDNDESTELTMREKAYLDRLDKVIASFSGGAQFEPLVYDLLSSVEDLLPSLDAGVDVNPLIDTAAKVKNALDIISGKGSAPAVDKVYFGGVDLTGLYSTVNALIVQSQESTLSDEQSKEFFTTFAEFVKGVEAAKVPELAEIVTDAKESIEVFSDLDLDFDSLQSEYYRDILNRIVEHAQEPQEKKEEVASKSKIAAKTVSRKTVRIEEAKIDHFLENVGEMIILGEVFNNLQKQFAKLSNNQFQDLLREFNGANADYGNQVFQLQASLMDMRRVEIRNVTASLGRMVRDTANSLGKKINLIVEGESAVVDKSMLDDVNACLVHIVRNSCDHGIEFPQERESAKKDMQGVIKIEAANEDNALVLRVIDDGRGIDTDALRRKALESGRVPAAELAQMTEKQVRDMVFFDGFSTAQEVSDISGRGVGMSSVLEDIRRIGGSIDLKSKVGRGTEVSIRIPLSIMLSVLEGLIVKVDGNGYIVPVRNVIETICFKGGEISTFQGKGEFVQARGGLLPLVRLAEVFDLPATDESGIGVIIRSSEGVEFCLMVKEILDHQQVVIKRIGGLEAIPGILGGALLGDGTIGLVLNVDYFSTMCS